MLCRLTALLFYLDVQRCFQHHNKKSIIQMNCPEKITLYQNFILSNFGNPFSLKYAIRHSSVL